MTAEAEAEVTALRARLSEFKQELAKVIAGMQLGGDRKQRRELGRRMDACKRRAKVLAREVDVVLPTLDAEHASRDELETAAVFLLKVQELGNGTQAQGA